MANVRGQSLKETAFNMIASYRDSQIFEKENRGYLTVQLDQRGLKGHEDSNPYLSTRVVERNGEDVISHSDTYGLDQIKAIEAAGKSMTQPDGLHVIAFKGNIFPSKDKHGKKLVVNTKQPLEKSDFTLSKKTLENQKALTAKAKEAKKAAQAANQKEVPDAPALESEGMEAEASAEMEA